MPYLEKLDFIPESDIIAAYARGEVRPKVHELHAPHRIVGITIDSLDDLTAQDWQEWMTDRLLLGKYNDLWVPNQRTGESLGPEFEFSWLIEPHDKKDAEGRPYGERLREGFCLTVPVFVLESYPEPMPSGARGYDAARKSLLALGAYLPEFHDFSIYAPTQDAAKQRLQEMARVLRGG